MGEIFECKHFPLQYSHRYISMHSMDFSNAFVLFWDGNIHPHLYSRNKASCLLHQLFKRKFTFLPSDFRNYAGVLDGGEFHPTRLRKPILGQWIRRKCTYWCLKQALILHHHSIHCTCSQHFNTVWNWKIVCFEGSIRTTFKPNKP